MYLQVDNGISSHILSHLCPMPFHSTEFQHLWGPPPNFSVSSAPVYIFCPYSTSLSHWSSFYLETQLFLSTFLWRETRCEKPWKALRRILSWLGNKHWSLNKGLLLLLLSLSHCNFYKMLLGRPENLRENSQGRTNQEWEEVRSSVQGSQEPINTHSEELLLWAPPNSLMGAVWLFQWSLSFCSFFLPMTDISPFLSICKFVFSPSRCLSTFTVGGCKVLFQSQICNCNFVFGNQRLFTFALGLVTVTLVFLYEICNSYFVSEIIRNSLRAEVAAILAPVSNL